jgi:tRNA A-37 threonylcarbamoyl transferase component Bud32
VADAPANAEFKPHAFGKFFLLQRLAVGGMAEIYRARVVGAAGFEKELVVKRILPNRSRDQGFITMLVNEAKLTVQLTHSNITQIYECGIVDGTYFISMELVNGVSLKEVMQAFNRAGATLSPEQAIYMVLQLLHGLDYAHRKTDGQGNPLQIVHCDVSPDNCLVSFDGELKLLDFGIARAVTGLSNYKEGMLMGKLGYVAPEQASLETRWDHRVDIFAAGIVLYELLTRQKPFPKATDVDSLVISRKAKVVPVTTIDPRLPKELDQILAKALAYDPAKRYADARDFAEALVDVLFPTPHSAISDHLHKQLHQVFADRIARQRQARAHDALIMKVLANLAGRQQGTERLAARAEATPAPVPLGSTGGTIELEPLAVAPDHAPDLRTPSASRTARRPVVVRRGLAWSVVALLALLSAAAGAAGAWFGGPYLRRGALVVTSEPAGAEIALDGTPTGQRTPAVIENVDVHLPHEVVLSGPRLRPTPVAVKPEPGRLALRVHALLGSSVGTIEVSSQPPGAEVILDGNPVGVTPVSVAEVRLDQRHRIDLKLGGYEIDQVVVLPEKDGTRFSRTLTPAAPAGQKSR